MLEQLKDLMRTYEALDRERKPGEPQFTLPAEMRQIITYVAQSGCGNDRDPAGSTDFDCVVCMAERLRRKLWPEPITVETCPICGTFHSSMSRTVHMAHREGEPFPWQVCVQTNDGGYMLQSETRSFTSYQSAVSWVARDYLECERDD